MIFDYVARLDRIDTKGYALAIDIEFTSPRLLFQSYPLKWQTEYSELGLQLQDPAVGWGFQNEGEIDWEDLKAFDEHGVFKKAAAHGLNFGIVVSFVRENKSPIPNLGLLAIIESTVVSLIHFSAIDPIIEGSFPLSRQ